MRHLRTYTRIAFQEHFCDRCCSYIRPGHMYEAHVELREERKEHRIIVWKLHVNPGCEFPEEPDKEERDRESKIINSLTNREQLPLAA